MRSHKLGQKVGPKGPKLGVFLRKTLLSDQLFDGPKGLSTKGVPLQPKLAEDSSSKLGVAYV